jgi:hypothetical protein
MACNDDLSGVRMVGASGRHSGRGYVYIMKIDRTKLKVGCSKNPDNRLSEIRRHDPSAILFKTNYADEMNGAETAAQKAIEKIGNQRVQPHSDYFKKNPKISWDEIAKAAANAVYGHNRKTVNVFCFSLRNLKHK